MATNTPVSPSDSADVGFALRLGWTIAELRGRYRLLPLAQSSASQQEWHRSDEALPLSTERSEREQARQTEAVVLGLMSALQLSSDATKLSYARKNAASDARAELRILCKAVSDARTDADRGSAWRELTVFLYALDAAIQDELLSQSLVYEGGYELGRVIAESYWALDPAETDGKDMRSWSFLLGSARRNTVALLLRRLSSYLDPLTIAGIEESFTAWTQIADDPVWRSQADTIPYLQAQALLWRDILVGDVAPLNLVTPDNKTAHIRLRPILEAFRLQIVILFLAALCLIAGIIVFAGPADKHWLAVGLAVLGFFGITGASLAGAAKSYVHDLVGEIRLARDTQLVQEAATYRPLKQAHPSIEVSGSPDNASQASTPPAHAAQGSTDDAPQAT